MGGIPSELLPLCHVSEGIPHPLCTVIYSLVVFARAKEVALVISHPCVCLARRLLVAPAFPAGCSFPKLPKKMCDLVFLLVNMCLIFM